MVRPILVAQLQPLDVIGASSGARQAIFRSSRTLMATGMPELTVFRPSTGEWYVRYSSLSYSTTTYWLVQWGMPGDIPLIADFDGDRVAELAVFRPSSGQWYVRYSSLGYSTSTYWRVQWGMPGDVPLVANFDGDGYQS